MTHLSAEELLRQLYNVIIADGEHGGANDDSACHFCNLLLAVEDRLGMREAPELTEPLTPLLWPEGTYIETVPDGRGKLRISILADRPIWDVTKGDPHRPGTLARPITEAERYLTLDEISGRINGNG